MGNISSIDNLRGTMGSMGPPGGVGTMGSMGTMGPRGLTGTMGPIGLTGTMGAMGLTSFSALSPQEQGSVVDRMFQSESNRNAINELIRVGNTNLQTSVMWCADGELCNIPTSKRGFSFGNSTIGNASIRMTDGEFRVATGTNNTFGFGIKNGNIRTEGDINIPRLKSVNFGTGTGSKIYDDNDLRIETDDRLWFRTGGTDRVQINNDNMLLTRPINFTNGAAMAYKQTPANSFRLGFLNGRPGIEWNDGQTNRIVTFWTAGNNKALLYEDV
jgi:hypothetical protein